MPPFGRSRSVVEVASVAAATIAIAIYLTSDCAWTLWATRSSRTSKSRVDCPVLGHLQTRYGSTDVVARRALRDRDGYRPPPEPRARGPRTERDVANDVVFGVVAVELLFNHDRLDVEVGTAFRRAVYDQVLARLRMYSDSNTSEARAPAKSWRLQDRTLERQFSLSCYFTEEATLTLGMSRVQDPLLPEMQHACRDVLQNVGVKSTDDPVSSALIAWLAYNVRVGGTGETSSILQCRRRPAGYAIGKPEVSDWLLPVFVEHDRSAHSERMALIAFGDLVKSVGGKLHPDSYIDGVASVYASHTPCISCMAVFCQFKRRLPHVKLFVCFDTWGENRRWIEDGGIREVPQEEEESDH